MVTDLDESITFYRDVLALDIQKVGDRQAKFNTGESTLVLERDFEEDVLASFGLDPPGEERGDGVIVVIEVNDVESIYHRAKEAGADIRLEPTTVEWGRKMFLVTDPDGYIIEVSKPV